MQIWDLALKPIIFKAIRVIEMDHNFTHIVYTKCKIVI